jgi:hypothetical protein
MGELGDDILDHVGGGHSAALALVAFVAEEFVPDIAEELDELLAIAGNVLGLNVFWRHGIRVDLTLLSLGLAKTRSARKLILHHGKGRFFQLKAVPIHAKGLHVHLFFILKAGEIVLGGVVPP